MPQNQEMSSCTSLLAWVPEAFLACRLTIPTPPPPNEIAKSSRKQKNPFLIPRVREIKFCVLQFGSFLWHPLWLPNLSLFFCINFWTSLAILQLRLEGGGVCWGRVGGFCPVTNQASTLRVTVVLVKYFQDLIAAMIQPTAQLRQEVEVREVPVLILLFGSRFNERPLKKDLFAL